MKVRAEAGAEAGAAGLTTLLGVTLLLVVTVGGIGVAGDLCLTAARARAAADAAALAGVGVSPLVEAIGGGSADAAAKQVTRANGAKFIRSDTTGWPLRYRVVVDVEPKSGWVRRIVGPVRAEAVGAVRPRVPTSGESGV